MGQCCNHAPTELVSVGTISSTHQIKRSSLKKSNSKNKLTTIEKAEHRPLSAEQSSNSQSSPKEADARVVEADDADNKSDEYEAEEEPIDLSLFQDDVAEFIDFWYRHYGVLTREYIHNSLVKRVHTKVKEQYDTFPRESIDEFITTLPDLLETLEILVNIAIDGYIDDAVSMYKQYHPLLMSVNTGGERSVYTAAPASGQLSPMPIPERKKGGKHKQRDSFSIKLTPAYFESNYEDIYPAVTASKLPVPLSPSRSGTRTRSRSRSKSKSKSKSKSPLHRSDVIITDKDGIDLDYDDNVYPSVSRKITPMTKVVVTKAAERHTLSTTQGTEATRNNKHSLVVVEDEKDGHNKGGSSPSPDPVADEEAYTLFMGGIHISPHASFEEDQNQNMVEHIKMIQHSRTHSTVEERDSEEIDDDPSIPLKDSTDDIVAVIDKERNTESFGFDIETAEDAEIIMVGIMRTLWFDRIAKFITKYGLNTEIDDLFLLLSNALETAIGTFREYKPMMEGFTLHTRQGLRTTLELIRAIINDYPLNTVTERIDEIYDDPYSILIHFADRCDVACDFWAQNVAPLAQDIKAQLSMRVYSYSILNVPQETYEQFKQKGSIVRWSNLLLEFMESIVRFFSRNRHQDLMEYLLILAIHHEKLRIPSTLLGNMGDWLDEVFVDWFEEDVYKSECSDAIQFMFAFVGEVMRGAYEKPIYDTQYTSDVADDLNADEINENISTPTPTKPHSGAMSASTEIQFPVSFKSVAAIPQFHDGDDDDLTMNSVAGHCYNGSDVLSFNKHISAQGSLTFNMATRKYTANTTGNKSVSFGPSTYTSLPGSNLDLEHHPSLTDIVRIGPFTKTITADLSLPEHSRDSHSINNNMDDLHINTTAAVCPVSNRHNMMSTLAPPGLLVTASAPAGNIMVGNSPLSQLDSPTLSPNPAPYQPALTPNEHLFADNDEMTPSVSGDDEEIEDIVDTGRAVTERASLNIDNEQIKQSRITSAEVQKTKTLNVVFRDEVDNKKERERAKRARNRGKKRSFSSADHGVIKYLAPNSQNTYTNTAVVNRSATDYNNNARKSKKKHRKQTSKTSSQLMLGKQYEKSWKPMHFLQKIMDLEGRKIISNYAFAPSDGSLSSKIVDLSIFHQYFETAQQFWSRSVDVNDRQRDKINDKLLNVFSERITDSVRYKVHELFAAHHSNFVTMFCLYFKLVAQYLDKCKAVANMQVINPALVNNLGPTNNCKFPSTMTPSLKNQSRSGGKLLFHKRTFSQRASLSVGLSKFKLRSETTRADLQKGGILQQKHHHFHAEGQFFVREMLRMGTKHRSHCIEEKTLKLVAKCLIEVCEKQFEKQFNDKTKRAFTIAMKLGIKFMCVEPPKRARDKNHSLLKVKQINKKTPTKDTRDKKDTPQAFRAQSAQVYGGVFVD